VNVNYTASGVGALECWFSNDTFLINTSLATCGTNVTDVVWSEGNHNVTVWINDSSSNMDTSRVSFTIDTTPPSLNIIFPTNNTNHSTNTLNINFTRSDTNLESCWFSNDTYLANTTLTSCTNISGATEVTWSEGGHNVTIWVNDSAGNEVRDSVTFWIDSINPNLSIIFPTNNTFQITLILMLIILVQTLIHLIAGTPMIVCKLIQLLQIVEM